MTQNKPGFLTPAFLSALLLGCSHAPPHESLDKSQAYQVDEKTPFLVVTNNFTVWDEAKSHLKLDQSGSQSPLEMQSVEREINKAALQNHFQLCSKKDGDERSPRQLIHESHRAAQVLPSEKFFGIYVGKSNQEAVAQSDQAVAAQLDRKAAKSWFFGTDCPKWKTMPSNP